MHATKTKLLPLGEDLQNAEARHFHRALLHSLKASGTTFGRDESASTLLYTGGGKVQ